MSQYDGLSQRAGPGGSKDPYGFRVPDSLLRTVNARRFWGGGIPCARAKRSEEVN